MEHKCNVKLHYNQDHEKALSDIIKILSKNGKDNKNDGFNGYLVTNNGGTHGFSADINVLVKVSKKWLKHLESDI